MSVRTLFWLRGTVHADIVIGHVPRIGESVKILGGRPLRVVGVEWDLRPIAVQPTAELRLPEANVFLDFVPGMEP